MGVNGKGGIKSSRVKIIVAVAAAAILAVGFYFFSFGRARAIQYVTTAVTRGDITSAISATGTLSAVETVDVGTQISGTIKNIYIDYNSVVKKGQLIAEIDSATQEADVAQYEANLLSASASLENARAGLAKAQKDYKRTRELAAIDLISKATVDADESSLSVARAQAAAADAQVAQARATLTKAQINLGYTKIYSPVDGVVVARNVDAGQTVAASYQTPSIAEIARSLAEMQVEVAVDEADIGGVTEGQQVRFSVDAHARETFSGRVTQVRLKPKSANNLVTYTVIVKVDNDELLLMPGMTANVSLILQHREKALLVPNSAFRFKPSVGNGNAAMAAGPGGPGGGGSRNIAAVSAPTVYMLGKDKEPVKVEVERGITNGQFYEIISGLNEGNQVITGIWIEKEGS